MGKKVCDHTSVGMLVWRDDKLLLIERKKFPFGFAPPAGHVDGDPSFEAAARRELDEEVGLKAKTLKAVLEMDKNNPCRRVDGTWHHWIVYEVSAEGEVKRSFDETRHAGWFSRVAIQRLARRTEAYLADEITDGAWEQEPGIEPVWYEHFKELEII